MKSGKSRLYVALLSAIAMMPVVAQAHPATNPALADLNTTEMPRVTRAVDSNVVSVVGNSHLALLDHKAPLSAVPDATPMPHMQLILKRSALRQVAHDGLIAALHDPHSRKFQSWLTPEEYGATFGVADADIAATTAWLVSQGFTVHGVYPNKMQIDFSGTAGQVKRAFHTQENRYTIDNATHIANASDIALPDALKGVVVGVAGLTDLRPYAQHIATQGQFNPATHKFMIDASANPATGPQAISKYGVRGFAPYDLVKMYAADQLHQSGLTGKGITIAVVDDLPMVPADWTNFVAQFSLGSYGGTFAQVQPQATPALLNCIAPPAATPNTDFVETVLDAEWATAIAPSANIEVAICDGSNSSNFFGGATTAATNLVNGATRPDIISVSYGYGEYIVDTASKTAIDLLWAQADAEGISVFVSSGDSSSNPSFNGGIINGYPAIDANAMGTSPNDTVVGGTDTADVLDGTTSLYFSPTYNSQYGSALSYVPEIPWNTSCGNPVAATYFGYSSTLAFCEATLKTDTNGRTITSGGGSGGPSSVDAKPAYQRQIWNAAKDQSRDVPDVALFGGSYGGASWVVLCMAAYPCTKNFTGPTLLVAGTSLSSPMFAGIQALVDQGLAAKGLRADQGNAAPTLYALAAQEYGGSNGTPPATLAACNANNGTTGTSGCVFHNITSGGNSTNCIQQLSSDTITPDCYFYGNIANLYYPGYGYVGAVQVGLTSTSATKYNAQTLAFPAQPGWSFASGLGSVNAKKLLAAWEAFVDAP